MNTGTRLIGMLAIATAGISVQAPAGTAQAAIVCPTGYVCLQPEFSPTNQPILVKEGDQLKTVRLSRKTVTGAGERVGDVFRLADGRLVYVQRAPASTAAPPTTTAPTTPTP